MNRFALRCGHFSAVLAVAATLLMLMSGCRSALFTATYLLRGNNIKAQYNGLKGKKVAVVCRPVVDLTYRNSNVAKDLAKEIATLLEAHVSDIEVIPQHEVDEWTDANTWDDYAEVGKQLAAEMVVGVELQEFTIYQGQTLYQGKANVMVRVYDCGQPDRPVFERVLPQVVYPPNTGIATHEKPEREFRQRLVQVLAEQIARHFYDHDALADYALDATALD